MTYDSNATSWSVVHRPDWNYHCFPPRTREMSCKPYFVVNIKERCKCLKMLDYSVPDVTWTWKRSLTRAKGKNQLLHKEVTVVPLVSPFVISYWFPFCGFFVPCERVCIVHRTGYAFEMSFTRLLGLPDKVARSKRKKTSQKSMGIKSSQK